MLKNAHRRSEATHFPREQSRYTLTMIREIVRLFYSCRAGAEIRKTDVHFALARTSILCMPQFLIIFKEKKSGCRSHLSTVTTAKKEA